jgi:hypothetical protein
MIKRKINACNLAGSPLVYRFRFHEFPNHIGYGFSGFLLLRLFMRWVRFEPLGTQTFKRVPFFDVTSIPDFLCGNITYLYSVKKCVGNPTPQTHSHLLYCIPI